MIALCDRFPGLDPIKLRATPALEYFRLIYLYKQSTKDLSKGSGSKLNNNVVIRREVTDETATGGWF